MHGYEHAQIAEDLALAQSEPYGPAPERASDPPQRRVLKEDANPDAIRLAMVHALLAIESSIPIEPIRVFHDQ
jgi:hypothetical protein